MALTGQVSNVHFLESLDETIRPVSGWHRTGDVEADESGAGCKLRCVYCNQAGLNFNDSGERQSGYLSLGVDSGLSLCTKLYIEDRLDAEISVDEAMQALRDYPYYTPSMSIILENTNDPGLDWNKTAALIRALRTEFNHTGPINFITKMGISDKDAQMIADLRSIGANVIGTVTLANLPSAIEPASFQSRVNTIRRLSEAGLPVIMSMRPMIEGINTDDESIRSLLELVKDHVDLITVGGLFMYDFTHKAFEDAGFPLDPSIYKLDYNAAKINPPGIKAKVVRIAAEMGIAHKVQYHNSCAISQTMTTQYGVPTHDRIAHWMSPSGEERFDTYCSTFCDPDQIEICKGAANEEPDTVLAKANQALQTIILGQIAGGKTPKDMKVRPALDGSKRLVIENGSLLIEEIFIINEATGWYVNNLPEYEGFLHRARQAINVDMGQDFEHSYLGALQVGDDWVVFMDKVIDDNDNQTTLRWIRSRTRARVNLFNLSEMTDQEGYEAVLAKMKLSANGEVDELELRNQLDSIVSIKRYRDQFRRIQFNSEG